MRIKTREAVYEDPEFIDKSILYEIEGGGKSYNWIIANHYSLLMYINDMKYSYDDMLHTYILCKACVLEDKESPHFNSKIIKNNQSVVSTFSAYFYYGSLEHKIIFINEETIQVNLLYLFKCMFNIHKYKVYSTRLYDDKKRSGYTSNSYKNYLVTKTTINNEFTNLIESELTCKSQVFLFPICDKDGKDVEWYIDLKNDESLNKDNAKRKYSEYINRNKQKSTYNPSNVIDIENILKKREKFQEELRKNNLYVNK